MITLEDLKIHNKYSRTFSSWSDKIHGLENCCLEIETSFNKAVGTVLQLKIENLKSYFYSAKYYATSVDEDSKNRIKELFEEMKALESEITSIIKTADVVTEKKIL
jgi:hypothetical protein